MSDAIDDRLNPWWRYTWTKDGALSTLERAEGGRQEDGKFVGYVRAATKEGAAIAAKRAIDKYARQLTIALGRVKSRVERLESEGLCIRCGKEPAPEPPHKCCEACRARVAERAKAIRHGAPRLIAAKAVTEEEKLAAHERVNEAARERRRRADLVIPQNLYMRATVTLKALNGALWKFDRAQSPQAFRRWLLSAIEEERAIVAKRHAAERGEVEQEERKAV